MIMENVEQTEDKNSINDRIAENEKYFTDMLNTISSRVYFSEYYEPPKVHQYMKKKEKKENKRIREEIVKKNKIEHYDPTKAYTINQMKFIVEKQEKNKGKQQPSRKRKQMGGKKDLKKTVGKKNSNEKEGKDTLSRNQKRKEKNKRQHKLKMIAKAKKIKKAKKEKKIQDRLDYQARHSSVKFSKIDFGKKNKTDVKKRSLKSQLKEAEQIQNKIKNGDGMNLDKDVKSKLMKNALKKVKGVKVKDDVKRIKKTMKRVQKKKEKSKKKWNERNKQQKKEQKERMKKREVNLKKKKTRGKK
ncbi:surfeit locus protein [Anaeramoeba flamelloides]|uniref:Surfeit locus protein n=2 Tax=Anaeramoeba flamelloides TaxID=1746091 RepID=A0AAV7ZUL1_9EUKA|nr:surfeit locus protein [Anaeramoeba flamelloides]